MFDVTFSPSAPGDVTATLNVADDEPGGPDTFPARGDGTYLEVRPAQLELTGGVTAGTVTVGNAGHSTISIASIAIAGPGSNYFKISSNTCGGTLAAGATCAVTVQDAAVRNPRPVAELVIVDSDAGSPQQVLLVGAE